MPIRSLRSRCRRMECPAAMIFLAAGLAASAMAGGQAWVQPVFEERPGQLEFSGTMIVRPLQPGALAGRGLNAIAIQDLRDRAVTRIGRQVLRHYPEVDEYTVQIPEGMDENTYATLLMATGDYQYVTPNYIAYPVETPNDPLFNQQWHHVNIQSELAWDTLTGDPDYIIAFADTGIDLDHPDLADHRVLGYNAPDDLAEADGGQVFDQHGHGTHVAGCGAGIGNNGVGIAGVNWDARIMMCKVTNDPGGGAQFEDLYAAARWAAENGARSVSCSYTGIENPGAETTGEYIRSLDALYLYAADNYSQNHNGWDHEHVTVVGATDPNDERAWFSSYGRGVDVFAPGTGILSSTNGGGYEAWDGTSMATPLANGVVSLIWSADPTLTADEVEDILEQGCDDMGEPGEDLTYGWGRVNSYKSLQLADTGVSIKVATPPGNLQAPGDEISFDVTVKKGKDEFVPNSQTLHFRYDGGDFQTSKLVFKEGNTWVATLPETSCGDEPEFYVSVEGQQTGLKTWPKDAPANLLAFDVGELETNYQSVTGFNNGLPNGWTADGFWVVTDECSVGQSCDGGSFAYFGKEANCNYRNQGEKSTGSLKSILTLPDVPPAGSLSLSYCYNLQTENKPGLDTARVYIDGVQVHQASESPNAWTTAEFDVTAYAGQTVELRFTFDTKDGYYNNFRGWQVDGIQFGVTDVVCRGGDCYADYNGDGSLDFFDFLAFTNSFNAGDNKADCDTNGVHDFFDFLCYQNAYVGGC
jgi:subtilisin family serine protease